MRDKDLPGILARIDPIIDHWYFTDLPTPRALPATQLQALWQAQTRRKNVPAECFASPAQALNAAALATEATDRIVVFGSFFTVGGGLRHGVPVLRDRTDGTDSQPFDGGDRRPGSRGPGLV